ncbi:MAG: YggS family pyridoxal phosphate-dependent enzyme [Actinobacteria bacterium]|nr:YggS family pyridoxal phosphate-dependent enzyme [Actinomycetota bacterium]
MSDHKTNIECLRQRIVSVCSRISRNPEEIRIIAASKYADPGQILEVSNLGISEFGENRAEELKEKYEIVQDRVIWHFFGHLQTRKIRFVVPIVEYIHSIDSMHTLEKVNREAFLIGKIQKILMEVNVSGETTKYGMQTDEVEFFLQKSGNYNNIRIEGFMTLAPLTDDRRILSEVFSKLLEILNKSKEKYPGLKLKELSMGMSNDFETAIENGATMVRIGSLIFK